MNKLIIFSYGFLLSLILTVSVYGQDSESSETQGPEPSATPTLVPTATFTSIPLSIPSSADSRTELSEPSDNPADATVIPTESSKPTPTETPVVKEATPAPVILTACDCRDETCVDTQPSILQPPKIGFIPTQIQKLNLKGSAVFKLLINLNGKVSRIEILNSSESMEMDQWLLPILGKTIWIPATAEGQPKSCWRQLQVTFYTQICSVKFPDIYKIEK